MREAVFKKGLIVGLIIIVFFISDIPLAAEVSSSYGDIDLPPPMNADMSVEKAIFRRVSVRNFTEEPVTLEELSTVLWAAYGIRDDGRRTISGVDGIFSVQIYVLREDAVYSYDPVDHKLVLYKLGDYRYVGQYMAPILFGLVWNKTLSNDENLTCAVMGQIGQNIHFMTSALNLGTVVNADLPGWSLTEVGLPPNEVPKIIMPMGHPSSPYKFIYLPMWISLLPRVRDSGVSLTRALNERNESTNFSQCCLTRKKISQMLWASYGYSYLLDLSKPEKKYVTRHRTVPSAHGYYPLRMYAVTKSGVNLYVPGLSYIDPYGIPIVSFLIRIRFGDKRNIIGSASESFVSSAPLIIIAVLDLNEAKKTDDFTVPEFRWLWYYEAGACAYNVLLDATAWSLSGNIVIPQDDSAIRDLLRLNNSYIPLFIVPVG